MRKKNIITALVITMIVALGVTAYASTSGTPGQRLGLGRITSMRGYDYMTSVLKNRLGLSDEEITKALNSGKTPYDLAAEKGITQEQFKTIMLEEKSKAINEAAVKGTITKEQAAALKENLSTNMESCTGNFGERQGLGQGQGRGQGRGMMGNGQGRGCVNQIGN